MKSLASLQGLKEINSIRSKGIRSIPKMHRSSYLDLYTLIKEKDRLEREIFALEKRLSIKKRQFDSIVERIDDLLTEVGLKNSEKQDKVSLNLKETLSAEYKEFDEQEAPPSPNSDSTKNQSKTRDRPPSNPIEGKKIKPENEGFENNENRNIGHLKLINMKY